MTDRPFSYDEALLECCARSAVGRQVVKSMIWTLGSVASLQDDERSTNEQPVTPLETEDSSRSCVKLFELHAAHYDRQHTPLESLLAQTPSSNDSRKTEGDGVIPVAYRLGHTMKAFVANVVLIEEHNSAASAAADDAPLPPTKQSQHRLVLNRFSDQPIRIQVDDTSDLRRHKSSGRQRRRRMMRMENGDASFDATQPSVTLYSSDEIVQAATLFGLGYGSSVHRQYSYKQQQPSKRISFDQYPKPIRLPVTHDDETAPEPFRTPSLASGMDGTLVSIKRQKNLKRQNRPSDDDLIDSSEPINEEQVDMFATSINWATEENPDGSAIVHDAMDQGTCGSCWASSAAASVAASAARREAYKAYVEYLGNNSINSSSSSNATQHAIRHAQHIEQAALQLLDLSIQELLDCDTEVDQGCTGGNPLLAFNFIHKYGLVGADRYPYLGVPQTCNAKFTNDPVASVDAWGILPSDSENHMELAIRHIGPISVGINGADPSFLSYDGGIFSKENCKQGANHALLIVGYGEEQTQEWGKNTTTTTRYWIARNSWGKGWGENGFVRIKRHDGRKGTPGECGIARSPSVALGGALLHRVASTFEASDGIDERLDRATTTALGGENCGCGSWPHGTCPSNVWYLGLIAMIAALFVVWPLSHDYRQRSRRRREARMQALADVEEPNATLDEEKLRLVSQADNPTYGTNEKGNHGTGR